MNETTFELTGITCANCAQKIEDTLGTMEGVHSARLSFATQKLNIIHDPALSPQHLESEVRKTVIGIESGAEVVGSNSGGEKASEKGYLGSRTKREILVLAVGVSLFAAGYLAGEGSIFSSALFLLAWGIVGWDVLLKALSNLVKGHVFDENLLMTVATVGAIATAQYPEAAAVMLFYKVGMLLEDMAVNRSRRSITELMDLKPESANLKTSEGIVKVAPETVKAGDIIVVKPGERIPVDCIVTEGESFIDASSLTGESLPVRSVSGDQLLGGSINKTGVLTLRVEKPLEQSAVTRILSLVENAASKKAPLESFISRFAAWYTPVVIGAAFLTAVLPPVITGSMDFKTWIYRAMIFLVVSCPCALVVSIPLTFFGGIGKASSRGILVKGGNYLEALTRVDTVVFDKTGTLTEGKFSVSRISPNGCSEEDLLHYAAYAEANSTHPIAQSILRSYGKPVDGTLLSSCEETAGKGVKVSLQGKTVAAGNMEFIKSFLDSSTGETGIWEESGKNTEGTLIHVSVDGEYRGWIMVSDTLRSDSEKAVNGLRRNGVRRIFMLTGDSRGPAEAIGSALKLDGIHSGLLPHQKVELFERIKREAAGKVVFAGDGINDAPVLAMADIGVSMGGLGSDAAIEASDIVLMTDEPSKLAEAVTLSKATKRIAMQNIVFAIGIKVLVLSLSIFGLATMWEAVFADVGVTVLAVLNTIRIRYFTPPEA